MSFCYYCKRTLNDKRTARRGDRNKGLDYTTDHKIPSCRGGSNSRENKVPCCFRCNNLKGDMTSGEFFRYVKIYGFERQPQFVKDRMKHEIQYVKL